MARGVDVHPAALLEAENAAAWYATRNLAAGVAFGREIGRAIALVVDAPERWPPYVAGTRRVLVRRFPFHVVYRVEAATILIVAIAHASRRPGYWRRRL